MAEAEDEEPGVPEWVVTYGDMMSLLLTFFIMLVSMSETKSDGSNRSMLNGINKAFGPSDGTFGVPGRSLQETGQRSKLSSKGARAEGGLQKASRQSTGLGGAHQTVKRLSNGTVVTLGGPAMFDRFAASLSENLKQNLDVIARVSRSKSNRIIVRGHASAEPLSPNSQYRDQMDLSFARAHNVAQYLIEQGIDRNRILISGAGASERALQTRRGDKRWRNRRVDVFLIDSYITPSN